MQNIKPLDDAKVPTSPSNINHVKDILIFIPYKIANEGNYSDKEIWNQLLEEGELQYEYSEYNKYLDSPHARRLSSTNDRFIQDDFNRDQV